MAETLLQLRAALAPEISEESCVIIGLFHDVGKVGLPGKPTGAAQSVSCFAVYPRFQMPKRRRSHTMIDEDEIQTLYLGKI